MSGPLLVRENMSGSVAGPTTCRSERSPESQTSSEDDDEQGPEDKQHPERRVICGHVATLLLASARGYQYPFQQGPVAFFFWVSMGP
jgi:hypothetical protein